MSFYIYNTCRYADCEPSVVRADEEMAALSKAESGLGDHVCVGGMKELLLLSRPPSCAPDDLRAGARAGKPAQLCVTYGFVESMLQQAIAHLVRGRAGLEAFLVQHIDAVLDRISVCQKESPSNGEDGLGGNNAARLLRVFCHLCLWVRNAADPSLQNLPALTDEILFKVRRESCHKHTFNILTHVYILEAYKQKH